MNHGESHIDVWARPNAVNFYSTHRNTPQDLYESEVYFLPGLLRPSISVLDVGCAAGGFCQIFRELQPDLRYTGVDASEEMIAMARNRYPESRFVISSADQLPFQDAAFDLVVCTGVLPMVLTWRNVLRECWRVAREHILFDVRVVADGHDVENVNRSYIKLAFAGEWDGQSIAPYIVVTLETLYNAVSALQPQPAELSGYGYYHAVSDMAVTPFQEVCMTMLCIGKRRGAEQEAFRWEVPLPWPPPCKGGDLNGQGHHL